MSKLKNFFNREQNLLFHLIATILVIIFGFVFNITKLEWTLVVFVICLVLTSELLNSSIELLVDSYTNEFHPLAKVAKDTAAAGVLVSALGALCVGLYVFLPKLIYLIK